jgi:hypothetical protein
MNAEHSTQTTIQPTESGTAAEAFDKSIFHNVVPGDQLAFLNHFSGTPSGEVLRDKRDHPQTHGSAVAAQINSR